MSKTITICTIFALFMLTGCADTVTFEAARTHQSVGFWHGLWHGMILPFAWVGSLFDGSISIYAIYNNGGGYDFGFMLGIGSFAGGSSSVSKKH